ncbi:MAG TPA: polysaccharide biosynthesis/export family protein [Bryobacteraceae bacterium]|nr:polysaccharide biosynthesis/export family protein [Bryobacteraceae bacterium]
MNYRIALCLTIVSVLRGQTPAGPPHDLAPNLPSLAAGDDDLISISVYGEPELNRTVRVSREGTIRIPMLSKPLPAAGLMPAELEKSIARALVNERILVDPIVTVTIAEYRSRPVTVVGAVNHPLKFQADGPVPLIDAISRAQGLAPNAGAEILVTMPESDGKPGMIRRIPVKRLIGAADPDLNITLHGGEEIRVPEAGKVFVVGSVKKPGLFQVENASTTTVLKVLAQAEGLAPYASHTCFIYRKDDQAGKSLEIPFDIHNVLARKSPDVILEANDVLYVPDNSRRRVTMGTLEKLLVLGSATTAALVYATTR